MLDAIDHLMNPAFLATLLAAVAAFATVLALVMPLLARDRAAERMKAMAVERNSLRAQRMTEVLPKERVSLRGESSKGIMQRVVDSLDLRKKFDSDELRNQLKMAGLRGQGPLYTYIFFRLAAPPLVFLFALFYLFVMGVTSHPPIVKLLIAAAAAFVGYYLPNLFLKNLTNKRQQAIQQSFPDALDMLLICVQSGMSVEAGFQKVSKEILSQSVELAEELSLTTAELSYLQDRRQAYENLGLRTGLPGVKAVTMALIQAERYGTPVGSALRTMAKENRDIRMAAAEKKAAALPPKLTVPMIIFFLPVLFVIIIAPMVIGYMTGSGGAN
jgi:tight adherence protein C